MKPAPSVADRPYRILTLLLTTLVLAACGSDGEGEGGEAAPPPEATTSVDIVEDIAGAYPDQIRVALENEYVRVLRFDLEPGTALPAHEGRRRVVYALGDYEIEWSVGDAAPERRSWSRGDVHAHDPAVHTVRNVGATPASFVVFERLGAPLPSAADLPHGADELPAGVETVLTEPDLTVLEAELAPGEGQEMHPGTWRVIYSLTDYTLEWEEGEDVGERSWSAGQAHWHEPGPHAATNVGDTPARWVIVTFGE
jgi:hypothetical protein